MGEMVILVSVDEELSELRSLEYFAVLRLFGEGKCQVVREVEKMILETFSSGCIGGLFFFKALGSYLYQIDCVSLRL